MGHYIKGMNPLLQYISDLMSVFQVKPIAEPQKYRDKVLAVKDVLKHDVSGLVSALLDYGIGAASSANYRIDCDDPKLTESLNGWLTGLNDPLRGRIPTGISSLSKEYFRERWKGSSHLLLRTFWEKKEDLTLPTVMYFVDGEDIKVMNSDAETVRLGDEKYYLRVNNDLEDDIRLPEDATEEIFVQKPYESWGTREPRPYLMRRGLWHNLMFMQLMSEKGEFIVARALEYLFLIKKGSEKMFLEGSISYSRAELETISRDFQELLAKKKYEIPVINGLPTGTPTYATQFDTNMEHLIPDYSKAVNEGLFITIERRLLAGLGLVDILEGVASGKRTTMLNPKPFLSEVKTGVKDFEIMLKDIVKEAVDRNKKKLSSAKIRVISSPIPDFLTTDAQTMLRSMYDRGLLSRRTLVEVIGEFDYEIEKQRREDEYKDGDATTMFPPIIQNLEQQRSPEEDPGQPQSITTETDTQNKDKVKNPDDTDSIPLDKQGPEKKNFKNAKVIGANICIGSVNLNQMEQTLEISEGIKAVLGKNGDGLEIQAYLFDRKLWVSKEAKAWVKENNEEMSEAFSETLDKDFEQAPYKNNDELPPAIKKYPAGAQSAFREAWMNAIKTYNNEQTAFRVAWSVLKKYIKKHKE